MKRHNLKVDIDATSESIKETIQKQHDDNVLIHSRDVDIKVKADKGDRDAQYQYAVLMKDSNWVLSRYYAVLAHTQGHKDAWELIR